MIRVSVEVREGTVTRRAEITAPSVARALDLAGAGKHGRRVRLLFPMEDPETVFVPTAHHVRGVA